MRFISNLKVKHKLFLYTGVILGFFILLFAWTIVRMNKNIRFLETLSYEQALHNEISSIKIKHQNWMTEMSQRVISKTMRDSMYITEESYKTCAFGKWFAGEGYENAIRQRPDLKALLAQTDSAHVELHKAAQQFNTYCVNESNLSENRIQSLFLNDLVPKYNEMHRLLTDLSGQVKTNKKFEDIYKLVQNMAAGSIILFIAAFIVIILLMWLIIRDITKPVAFIEGMTKRISEGDLTQNLDLKRKDEFGSLIDSMNKMTVILQNVIESVAESIEEFINSASEIDSDAHKISEGTSQQAASVEQVMAAMEEMLASITANISSANETETIAEKVTESAESGQKKINEAAEMLKLIAKKINVISDVAYQTNILSLNASIEASRAGEAGKGFAVVAAEIGELAEKSKLSAASIGELSGKSIATADQSQELFKSLLEGIEKTYGFVVNFVTAGHEQENSAKQVNLSVGELNNTAQQNASSAQNLAENAADMKEQIKMLKEMIEHFTT